MKRAYEKLVAWKEAHELCLAIYKLTRQFPNDERYGLTSQMRRSAYSVPMNVAEGNGRRTFGDKAHFIDISIGSLEELHYQVCLARDLNYCSNEQVVPLDDRMQRTGYLLTRLRQSLS